MANNEEETLPPQYFKDDDDDEQDELHGCDEWREKEDDKEEGSQSAFLCPFCDSTYSHTHGRCYLHFSIFQIVKYTLFYLPFCHCA